MIGQHNDLRRYIRLLYHSPKATTGHRKILNPYHFLHELFTVYPFMVYPDCREKLLRDATRLHITMGPNRSIGAHELRKYREYGSGALLRSIARLGQEGWHEEYDYLLASDRGIYVWQ